jgi:M6 family metalloprotease-like protein
MPRLRFRRAPIAALATCAALVCAARTVVAQATRTVTGEAALFVIDRDDPARPSPFARHAPDEYLLRVVDDGGRAHRVVVTGAQLRAAGGVAAFDGARVAVDRDAIDPAMIPQARAVRLTATRAPMVRRSLAFSGPATTESRPWLVLLCRFPDSPVPVPGSAEEFQRLFTGSPPTIDDYYALASFGAMSHAGTRTAGWFTLAKPRAAYIPESGFPDTDAMLRDCVAAADPTVDFRGAYGIAMQFDRPLQAFSGLASLSPNTVLTLDGTTRRYGTMWITGGADALSPHGLWAHEFGHTMGWLHSSEYETRVSQWDVMSFVVAGEPTGPTGIRAGAFPALAQRDYARWVPPSRRWTPGSASSASLVLDWASQPTSATSLLLAEIPVRLPPQGGAWNTNLRGVSYVVEARRRASYDVALPGDAVVHRKESLGVAGEIQQFYAVSATGNPREPNSEPARWTPGRTFRDTLNAISISVDSFTARGAGITVRVGATLAILPEYRYTALPPTAVPPFTDSILIVATDASGQPAPWAATAVGITTTVLNPFGTGTGYLRFRRSPQTSVLTNSENFARISTSIQVTSLARTTTFSDVLDWYGPPQFRVKPFVTTGSNRTVREGSTVALRDSAALEIGGWLPESGLAWSATARAPWVQLLRRSGLTRPFVAGSGGALLWARSAEGLAPGVYVDTIRVSVPGAVNSFGPPWRIDTLVVQAATRLVGDVDNNNQLNSRDALLILTLLAGGAVPGEVTPSQGDADCDGRLTARDALIVLSATSGVNTSQFCVGQRR